jgi:adenylate cyclase
VSEFPLEQPDFIAREDELAILNNHLDQAISGKGSMVLISGEAGVGKTRLMNEIIKFAEQKDIHIARGMCLAESLEPLMPIKYALKDANLFHLVSGAPPPLLISIYLINNAGVLISKAEREESGLDSDIFGAMLKAVGDFVSDSLSLMGRSGSGLNSIGYEKYKILIQTLGNYSIAAVIEGNENEFIIYDMRRTLQEIGNQLDGWSGEMSEVKHILPKLHWFINSGKYNGRFLVDDSKLFQENFFDNVLLGLQRVSTEKTMLFFIEDLHWADPTTLTLLHYVARNIKQNRIVIFGTFRPEDVVVSWDGKPHQLEIAMQKMNREDLFVIMQLIRFDRAESKKLINKTLGNTIFEEVFYERVYKETEGTPFFILEIIKLLVEDEIIAKSGDGIWRLKTDINQLNIPSKVYDVIKRRLDRLLNEQRRILDCASVVGEEFQSDIVSKAIGCNKLQLLENLNDIEKAHRLIHFMKHQYKFDHSKVREVLYNGISEELRKEYHRVIGDIIAEHYKDDFEEVMTSVVYHYYEAGDQRAGNFLIQAGKKAMEKHANEEAIRFYEKALETIGTDARAGILENIGDIQLLTSDYEKAIDFFEKAIASTKNPVSLARLQRKVGEVHEKRGEFKEALLLFAKSKGIIKNKKSLEYARVCVEEGYTLWKQGNYNVALPILLEALEVFKASGGEDKDSGKVQRLIGNVYWKMGKRDDALNHYNESLSLMERARDMCGIASGLNNIGLIYQYKGEADRAIDFFKRSLDIDQKIGDKLGIAQSLNNIAFIHSNLGEVDKALEYYHQSLEIKEKIGDRYGIGLSLNNIGNMHLYINNLDVAHKYLNQSLEILTDIGDKRMIASVYRNLGILYRKKGDVDKGIDYQQKSFYILFEEDSGEDKPQRPLYEE